MGAAGFRLFRRIVFPLAMPGYIAGAALVFVKVFDDLATPLLLNVKDMLAPQAYLRVTSIGIADPMGYVISVVLIVASVFAVWLSTLSLSGKDYATVQRGGGGLSRRKLKPLGSLAAYSVVTFLLLLVLAPHIGLLILSFATVWSFSPLPDDLTTAHYARVFDDFLGLHQEHADLRLARGGHRRRRRRRHRLPRAAHKACRPRTGSTGRPPPRSRCRALSSASATCARSTT